MADADFGHRLLAGEEDNPTIHKKPDDMGAMSQNETTQSAQPTNNTRQKPDGMTGDETASPTVVGGSDHGEDLPRAHVDILAITRRLQKSPVWSSEIMPKRDELMRHYRKVCKLFKAEAQAKTYAQLDQLYPPQPEPEPEPEPEPPQPEPAPPELQGEGTPGISDHPEDWPELPANASLQADVAWVNANRLRVRDPDGRIRLDRALTPAPSHAALSWLETSILFPSKFADISVKATAQQADEQESVRRERRSIEEVRAILAEMLPDSSN